MKNDCNLELSLQPASSSDSETDISGTDSGRWDGYGRSLSDEHCYIKEQQKKLDAESKCGEAGGQQDQRTIFCDGRICACDVTELQARTIIIVKTKEVEGRTKTLSRDTKVSMSAKTEMAMATTLRSQLQSPTNISMRKSLQCFLQKRKHRIVASSPYGYK